jgi:beta-lactamase regulating signal transducer with metallopeptidase domain
MLYGILVGVLLAVCSHAAQSLGRHTGVPARWIWSGAMAVTVAMIAAAPFRAPTPSIGSLYSGSANVPQDASLSSGGASRSVPVRFIDATRTMVVNPIGRALLLAEAAAPVWLGNLLLLIWIISSTVIALLLMSVHNRFSAARQRWPMTVLRGVQVRVAPAIGPAVIGIRHPEIVIPRWLLAREAEDLHLVLTHESQHLYARDPWFLAAAWTVAVMLPWNPAIWWMLSRLRLAVELDCDARVLRDGAAPLSYGALLINLAEQCSTRTGAPALADDSSHLRQRLIAMKPDIPRFPRARALTISAVALFSLAIACETSLPTQADVNNLTVASAEAAASKASIVSNSDSNVIYTINDAVVSRDVARALPPGSIREVSITRSAGGHPALVRISTGSVRPLISGEPNNKVDASPSPAFLTQPANFSGLYFIDGAPSDAAAVKALDPSRILSIQVTKGATASTQYNDPRAANGVIAIITGSNHKP